MSRRIASVVCILVTLIALTTTAIGGGPLIITGPNANSPGKPMVWATMPITYTLDSGPMSATSAGTVVITNSAGKTRVTNMFGTWQNVATANISFTNGGAIKSTTGFLGGDVRTFSDFAAVMTSCNNGEQNPIVFDADGSILAQLIGDPGVIGYTSICRYDPVSGHILAAGTILNGIFQDGVSSSYNYEITAAQFDQVFVHEFGHFVGLDHSQFNVNVFNQTPDQCDQNTNAGLPVMFPYIYCQARVSAGLSALAPDDVAWISYLYPSASTGGGKQAFSSKYGLLTGNVYFSDGATGVQGVNVTASQSTAVGFSGVSGVYFTDNLGQSVTCVDQTTCNTDGSSLGSRDPLLMGRYTIPVLAGTYTVSTESVDPQFQAGSGLNPLNPPVPMPGIAATKTGISVAAGATVNLNLTLQGTPPTFDQFESSALIGDHPLLTALLHLIGGAAQ
jgi:hypothetical protein